MFVLLESEVVIGQAQKVLEKTFKREFSKVAIKTIGYPGGKKTDAAIRTDGVYWYWAEDHYGRGVPHPRRLNWFGLFRDSKSLQISVEVNTTYEGRDDSVAGFFAKDTNSGRIYLMHSGRVGGGKKGVGKKAFLTWFNRQPVEVATSSGDVRDGVIVMPIQGRGAVSSATRYIDAIAQFKLAVRTGELNPIDLAKLVKDYDEYFPEARGRRVGKRSSEFDYISRHGDVVDELHVWRSLRPMRNGTRFVKNRYIDLGVAAGKKLLEVFEVKTSVERFDVYAAIGQLMTHGAEDCRRRVIGLPNAQPLPGDLRVALRRLEIEIIRFELHDKSVEIIET